MPPVLMFLFGLVVFAMFAGVLYWAINQFNLPPPIRAIIVVVFVLVCVVALFSYLPGMGLGGFGMHAHC